jgi:hypothetical protein
MTSFSPGRDVELDKSEGIITFCPVCKWRDVDVLMKPWCPECGGRLCFRGKDAVCEDKKRKK